MAAYETICNSIFAVLAQLAREAERSQEEKDSINASVMTIQNCHELHMAVKGLKMPSLDAVSRLAKQEYDKHLHEYAHLSLQRVLGQELLSFLEDLNQLLTEGMVAAEEIAYQSRFNKQTAKRIVTQLSVKELRRNLEGLWQRIQKHFRDEPGLMIVIWGRIQEELTSLSQAATLSLPRVYGATGEVRLTFSVEEIGRMFTECKK